MEGVGMLRRVLVGGLLAVSVAACGGSSPTPSPEAVSPVPTVAPIVTPSAEPSSDPVESAAVATTAKAACAGVGLRKGAATTTTLVGRIGIGTKVRIAETVVGETYEAGACGTGGDAWHKIDRVGGKSVKSLYGVQFVYSAAGFYE
jgi:hypothetical protein